MKSWKAIVKKGQKNLEGMWVFCFVSWDGEWTRVSEEDWGENVVCCDGGQNPNVTIKKPHQLLCQIITEYSKIFFILGLLFSKTNILFSLKK